MDVFAGFHGRVLAAVQQLKHDGVVPHDASTEGITLEPPKDASHGDFATNAAMVLAKAASQAPRALAERLAPLIAADPLIDKVEIAGPGFINLTLSRLLAERAAHAARAGRRLWAERHRQKRAGQRGICLGEPDRADACRPLPGRGVRRCARQSARLRWLRRDAGILCQRRGRAGRCARAFGIPALPRGARRGDRRRFRKASIRAII